MTRGMGATYPAGTKNREAIMADNQNQQTTQGQSSSTTTSGSSAPLPPTDPRVTVGPQVHQKSAESLPAKELVQPQVFKYSEKERRR
jgi:pyruvate/2-oxoacid:ferredoxin oxidoreductase beta subunit